MFSNLSLIGFFLLCSSAVFGDGLQATLPIAWQGKTIGFQTNDPMVEYMRPESWELIPDKTFVEETGTEATLYTVFKPSYKVALPYITQQKSLGSSKIFLPLPSVLEGAQLFLSDFLGKVLIEQVPNPMQNQSPYLYYKIRMNPSQLATVRKLAASGAGIVLTGSVTYSYETIDGPNTTGVSILGIFDQTSLLPRNGQGRFGLEWIVDLFTNYAMYLEGSLDGRYSLGAIAVSFERSTVQMKIDTAHTDFTRQGDRVFLRSVGENAKGRISLYIRELDTSVALDVRYAISGSIGLLDAVVGIDSIEVIEVTTVGSSPQPFVVKALNNYLKSDKIKNRLGQDLSTELQDRILNGDLFL